MRASVVLRLKFPSERRSRIIFEALMPEVRKTPSMRSRAFLEKEDVFLILKVEASDTVALRASVNAYLRWINSMVNVLRVLEKL
jgi:KEOPS complex subunit Pcc1